MVKIEFTKDYATKKKGESMEVDGMLASDLIRVRKVAKYYKEKEKSKAKKKD